MMTTRNKIHTVYKVASGEKVPSVTTVLGQLAKPALIHWAWEQGKAGLDYKVTRDIAAGIGTIAHALIAAHLRGEKLDTSEVAPADLAKAETSFLAFLEWWDTQGLKVQHVELSLTSEICRFGGTIDSLATDKDGNWWLLDYKTGKGVYEEAKYQVAAYAALVMEKLGIDIVRQALVRLDKETGAFEHHDLQPDPKHWQIFRHLLAVYQLRNAKPDAAKGVA